MGGEVLKPPARGLLSALAGNVLSAGLLRVSSVVVVLALHPQRSGGGGLSIEDTSGELTDSDAPLYAYNGDNGSDELLVDDLGADGSAIEAGDTVGVPVLWDGVAQAASVGSTVVGLPGTERFVDAPAIGPCTTSDYCEVQQPTATTFTLAVYFETMDSGSIQAHLIRKGTSGGLNLFENGSNEYELRALTSSDTTTALCSVALPSASGIRCIAFATRSGNTFTLRVYRTDTEEQTGAADSDIGGGFVAGATGYIGRGNGGTPYGGTGLGVDVFSAVLTTEEMEAIVAATDETAGGKRIASHRGLRTGVRDGSAPTRLLFAGSSGSGAITAELS